MGSQLSYSFARANGVLTIKEDGQTVCLKKPGATFDALIEARRIAGVPLIYRDVDAASFEQRLSNAYANSDLSGAAAMAQDAPEDLVAFAETLPQTADLLASDNDAPVIKLINAILQEAIKTRASDVHIEPYETRLAVRFRIDGALRDMLELSPRLAAVLVSRVKVMAKLDIAKKRTPQDGRFSLNLGERSVDVRVSTLPSQHGERVVMRLLEKTSGLLTLSDLGMGEQIFTAFTRALSRPNGIILVTGPTGSGKTTTLYASVRRLNTGEINIMTVEDPIEYALDGISQTQVNPRIGMSFAAGLRAILRQDPNVAMVGEIRDAETADIAVELANTGHLVLSTVHTNSALAAITRLRDLGVERFQLSSAVTALLAQRLVRRLCTHCRKAEQITTVEARELGLPEGTTLYRPVGCEHCSQTGYLGRVALYEIVSLDRTLREMIHDGACESDMAAYAFSEMPTLMQSGADAVRDGLTSVAEVLAACRTDE